MEIFPAIDLMNGSAVRLTKGDFDTKEIFSENPSEILNEFISMGANNLHLVDLDGAKEGKLKNYDTIKELASFKDVFIEVGGGIRNENRIEEYLKLGIRRVILGTAAVRDFSLVERSVREFGRAVAVGVDAKDGFVAIDGWKTVTQTPAFEFCRRCRYAGVDTVIFTDVSKDGCMQGTNLAAYRSLSEIEGLNITASGGISFENELVELKKIGVYAAILGKALYKGLISLERAVAIGRGQ